MMDADTLAYVLNVFQGSDGEATKELFGKLDALGEIGRIAVNLFRAQKNSERAKLYRTRSSSSKAYETKQWAMDNLTAVLLREAEKFEICWGWETDSNQAFHNSVLYIDLPTGQVSFHTAQRGAGPDYSGMWDGKKGMCAARICIWCAQLLVTVPGETI